MHEQRSIIFIGASRDLTTREKSFAISSESWVTKSTYIHTAPTKSIPDSIRRSYISRISIDSFFLFFLFPPLLLARLLSETRATAKENHHREESLVISGRNARRFRSLREKFDAVRRQTPRRRGNSKRAHEFPN